MIPSPSPRIPGYRLVGWEVVLGDVTVSENSTFVMPDGPAILRPIYPLIPALPQTGDPSQTALWAALMLLSLGALGAIFLGKRRQSKTR